MRPKPVQSAIGHVERHHAPALTIVHDDVDREVFDEKTGLMFQGLLIQRMQHGMTGTIGRGAGALRNSLAVMSRHAAKWPLINASILGARKRHAIMFELNDRGRRLLAHEFDGVL